MLKALNAAYVTYFRGGTTTIPEAPPTETPTKPVKTPPAPVKIPEDPPALPFTKPGSPDPCTVPEGDPEKHHTTCFA